MQYSISHVRPGRLASCIAAVALSLLLVFAARADAESLAAPIVAEDGAAAPAESAPPEPVGEQQSSPPAPSAPPAGTAATSETAGTTPTSEEDSSSIEATEMGAAASRVAVVAESTVESSTPPAQPGPAALPSDPAAGPVTEIRREADRTLESAAAAPRAAARALDRVSPIERVQALADEQLQNVGGALTGGLDRFASPIPRIPSHAAGGVDPTSRPASSVSSPPGGPSPASVEAPPFEQVIPMDGPRPFPAVTGDAAFPWPLTPKVVDSAPGVSGLASMADGGGVSPYRLGEHVETSPPPGGNGPAPSPDLPQLIASGASSSFVQIAALLALLAVAAPAILRWLRKAPGLRAPAPFARALECPG
jgi:hypothetical protein